MVIGASYSPLLVNVNAVSWLTNLIGYNGLVSYGSPSYYAQKMLGASVGDRVAPSQIVGGNGNLWAVASTKSGGVTYLTVVNRGASAPTVGADLSGVSGCPAAPRPCSRVIPRRGTRSRIPPRSAR